MWIPILAFFLVAKAKIERVVLGILCYGPRSGITLELLLDEFFWVTGISFPYDLLGFDSAIACMRSLRNVECFSIGRSYYIKRVADYILPDRVQGEDDFDWN